MNFSYTSYFDKDPLTYNFLGPSGILNLPFTVPWKAWVANDGIHYSGIHMDNDYVFGGFINTSNIENMSFALDNESGIWIGIGQENSILIINYISGQYNEYSFNGRYPQVFNNGIINPYNQEISCFYLCNNDKIYCRTSKDNFSGEHIVHELSENAQTIKQVYKLQEPYLHRIGIWGQYKSKDGFCLISEQFETFYVSGQIFESYFDGFELEVSGYNFSGNVFGVEPSNFPFPRTFEQYQVGYDLFEQYLSGSGVILTGQEQLISGESF